MRAKYRTNKKNIIIQGYIDDISSKYKPKEIIGLIYSFYDDIILFDVMDVVGNIVMNRCKKHYYSWISIFFNG